jgi:hypothetical protein
MNYEELIEVAKMPLNNMYLYSPVFANEMPMAPYEFIPVTINGRGFLWF